MLGKLNYLYIYYNLLGSPKYTIVIIRIDFTFN